MTHLPKITDFYPFQPIETRLIEHCERNRRKPIYSRKGGLRWLRLGRLTLSWSWRRQ